MTKSSATLIDNIFTNSLNNTTKSGILFTGISDHFHIFHFFLSGKTGHVGTNSCTKYRKYNSLNTERFKRLIDNISWENVYKHMDVESACQNFMTTFISAFHTCFPLVKTKKKVAEATRKPWYTPGLHKSAITKNKLYKSLLTNPTSLNLASIKDIEINTTI